MNPNEALKDAREALKNVLGARGREHTNMEALDKLADAFEALDGWMSRGGFLPTEWAKGEEVMPGRLSTHEFTPEQVQRVEKVEWFARCLAIGLKRSGPYKTQLEAWQAMRGLDGEPVPSSEVWPEKKV